MAHLVCMVPVISQEIAQAPVKSKSLALVAGAAAPLPLSAEDVHHARLFQESSELITHPIYQRLKRRRPVSSRNANSFATLAAVVPPFPLPKDIKN